MIPLDQARTWLLARLAPLPAETIPLASAASRVLAAPIPTTPVPPHPTAAIDGLALRAADTAGATDYAPLPAAGTPVSAGAPMPPGTDAVLPLADLDAGAATAPVATAPVAPGHGVTQAGHHAPASTLHAGLQLAPLHLALLALLGHATVAVIRRPRIRIRTAAPRSGPDALTPLLHALLPEADHADPPDLIIHAGRSGPGVDDHGPAAFTTLHAHGIAIRPGETSAVGLIHNTPAILLPGDPLACATAFALLVAPALDRLAGCPPPTPIPATLARKIASALGQVDAIRVRLHDGVATPLGPAEHGSLLHQAPSNGLVLVPEGSEGYPQGATIMVHPL